jgi:hypothetical protein
VTVERALALAYLLACIAIGLLASRKVLASRDEYWVAGRRIGTLVNAMAIMAALASGGSIIGVMGMAYQRGIPATLALFAGAVVGFPLASILVAKPLRSFGRYTLTDFLAFRYPRPVVRTLVPLLIVASFTVYIVAQMKAAGITANALLGIPYDSALTLTTLVFILYVSFGGMLAITWTDVVQGALLWCPCLELARRHRGLGALSDLPGRQVFLVGRHLPFVTERISHPSVTIAPEHVLNRHDHRGARRGRFAESLVDVLDVEENRHGRAAVRLGGLGSHLRHFVAEHHHRVPHPELRMHDLPSRPRHADPLLRAQGPFVEVDGPRRVAADQVGSHGVVTLRNRLSLRGFGPARLLRCRLLRLLLHYSFLQNGVTRPLPVPRRRETDPSSGGQGKRSSVSEARRFESRRSLSAPFRARATRPL